MVQKWYLLFSLLILSQFLDEMNMWKRGGVNRLEQEDFKYTRMKNSNYFHDKDSAISAYGDRMTASCISNESPDWVIDRKICQWKSWALTGKVRNNLQRTKNGNTTQKQLKILHWNLGAKLWKNKLEEVELLLDQYKPDICLISEANLWAGLEVHERELVGHKIILPDTMKSQGHARLVMVVRQELHVKVLHELMDNVNPSIWVRIGGTKKNSLVIGGLYREHQQLGQNLGNLTWMEKKEIQEERWMKIIRQWQSAGNMGKCIVLGDLNLDYRKWHQPEQMHGDMVNMVQAGIEPMGFIQLITGITRSWSQQMDSTLDHIWTNCNGRTLNFFNETRGISDHNVIGINFSLKDIKVSGQNVTRRKWKNFSEELFLEKLSAVNWDTLYNSVDPNLANTILEDNLVEILDQLAPMTTVQSRTKYISWLTDSTKTLMRERDRAREIARTSQSPSDWNTYRQIRNKCTLSQKNERAQYLRDKYSDIEKSNDSSQLYSLTRQLLGWKQSGPPVCLQKNGKTLRKQKEVAECQAEFYREKIKNIKNNLPRVRTDPMRYLRKAMQKWIPSGRIPELIIKEVTEKDIIEIIGNFKNSRAFGHDTIDAKTVKIGVKYLANPIKFVVNLSLRTNTFPAKWKVAKVCPLLKAQELDSLNPKSYRPVCQLSIFSKITERTVQLQLLEHMESQGLLSSDQHGYRRHSSTTTALLQIMDIISTGADANNITATMSIDQSSAFDCVEHALLLQKLAYYSLSKEMIQWIKSYLEFRSNYVAIGTAKSRMYAVEHGVPQGSVLGPLLYLVYINDIPLAIEDDDCHNMVHMEGDRLFGRHCKDCGNMTIFADDAEYLVTSNSRGKNQDKIEDKFLRIMDYLNAHGLEVNQAKTNLTEYMTRQKRGRLTGIPPELTVAESIKDKIEDKHITDSKYCRILGGNLKNDLSWDAHLSTGKKAVLPAVRKQLGALSKLRNTLSQKAKLKIANSLIISKLSYIVCLWGNTTTSQLRKAQVCINLAARFVLGANRTTSQKKLMEDCNWLTATELTEYHSLIQLWKVVRLNVPEYLRTKFTLEEQDRLQTDAARLQITGQAWRWKSKDRWNALPEELRGEGDLKRFKRTLRRHIMDRRQETQELEPD